MRTRITLEEAKEILRIFMTGDWKRANDNIGPTCIIINGRLIRLFFVGQTLNYDIESERGHVYAPAKGYPKMREVNAGDIIFSYQNRGGRNIRSINVALEDAEETYGTKDGLRIDCYYGILSKSLDIGPIVSSLVNLEPFDSAGHIARSGYIKDLHVCAAKIMLDEMKIEGITARL